ncbi:MAG: UDPGP type 1 family protein [Phycisphaerae bacterium]|nr:UDPGP type 1 family protein [Phycisphaerae bacterium]
MKRRNQEHLFTFWDELNAEQQAQLLEDIARIDLDTLERLIPTHVKSSPATAVGSVPEPADAWPARPKPSQETKYAEALALGQKLIAEGKVATMVVAGGQGTRLGFDRPKGEFAISPVMNKPLFRLFAEAVLATGERYGRPTPWYVMTGPTTDQPTREYFAKQDYFGLPPEDVFFFCQGVMPAVDHAGRILLDQKHRVALSPNGHGGCLLALSTSGALDDMRRRGIEVVSYFQVDNPLASPVDPLFMGLHALTEAQMSAIAVPKADDLERVGNFARVDGRLCVIEYTYLPDELAHARNPDGSRRFDDGSIAVHAFSRTFLESLTCGEGSIALPWHRAVKKVPFVDIGSARRIVPEQPNAVKLELFVFDALPVADRAMLLRQDRGECFSPVKNAEGVDSPATARRDMSRRAANWLESCGVNVPRASDGEPDGVFEISPRLALDADQLKGRLTELPTIRAGDRLYLG